MRKPDFIVSDKDRQTGLYTVKDNGYRFLISDIRSRGIVLSMMQEQRH